MELSIHFWVTTAILLWGYPCGSSPQGLLNLFGGGDGGDEFDNQSSEQASFPEILPNVVPNNFNVLASNNNGNRRNVNLFSLFPQNNVPVVKSGLDPETREKLTENKEKLEDILEKLKEMNRQKEEQKYNELHGNTGATTVRNVVNGNNGNVNNGYYGNINNGNYPNNNNLRPINNNGNYPNNINNNYGNMNNINNNNRPENPRPLPVPTERPAQKKDIWKKVITKKFSFQVRPVKPENELEALSTPETVYYVERF